jgi:microcystin degradation protein MlrC
VSEEKNAMTAPRIAIGGFLHETNTFAPSKATYADFVDGGGSSRMAVGEEIFTHLKGVNAAIAGAIRVGEAEGWELIPTLFCGASPSAHVTEDAFERIAHDLLGMIAAAGPLDGVMLDLHGAMVTEHLEDGEGELLARVRALVGPDVPVAVALDLHANVTSRMVAEADILDSYRTYPHVDMTETGERTARALAAMLGGARPAKAMLRAPFLSAIAWQCTEMEPARSLYAELARIGAGVDAISFNMGFPAADFPECGMTVVAYGAGADAAARALMDAVEAAEPRFSGRVWSADEGVAEAMRLAAAGATRPVVLADTQDNPGAGANSDTMGMLRAMLAAGASGCIGNVFDPAAAALAHAAGEGAVIRLALGGKSGVPGDAPLEAEFTVEALSDGRFTATGPYYGGRVMNMGPSARLRLGDVRIALTSAKAQMADREMFRFLGIAPEAEAVVVVKSSNHFRADFAPIAETILVCAAPGPMAVDPATLPWTRLPAGLRPSAMAAPIE